MMKAGEGQGQAKTKGSGESEKRRQMRVRREGMGWDSVCVGRREGKLGNTQRMPTVKAVWVPRPPCLLLCNVCLLSGWLQFRPEPRVSEKTLKCRTQNKS